MATWVNRWDGNILYTKTIGLMTVEEARQNMLDFKKAWSQQPGRFGVIADLSGYPTQSPQVADVTAETARMLDLDDPRFACLAVVVARSSTKMQLQRQGRGGSGHETIFCDDLDEARRVVREKLAAIPA